MPKKPLVNYLRVLRAARGLSQADLGQVTHIKAWRIFRIENGRVTATPEEKAAIARVFGVQPSDVFPETPPANPDITAASLAEGAPRA